MDILLRHPLVIRAHGYEVTAPEPAAYLFQKLAINAVRSKEKQEKDANAVSELAQFLRSKPEEAVRLGELFDELTKKKKCGVAAAAERLGVVLTKSGELNAPANIPLSYRAYALICVGDPAGAERDIHELIDMIGLGLACLSVTI